MERGGGGGVSLFLFCTFLVAYAQANEPYQTTLSVHHHLINSSIHLVIPSPIPFDTPSSYLPGTSVRSADQLAGQYCAGRSHSADRAGNSYETWSCLFFFFFSAHVLLAYDIRRNTRRTSVEELRNQQGPVRLNRTIAEAGNKTIGEREKPPPRRKLT